MIRDLAPRLGRRLACAVVPDWHGQWTLTNHPEFCRVVQEASGELLLHGCCHRRRRGWGPVTLLADGSDEMNGLDREETRRTLARGQQIFAEVFGAPARGFLAPAWQPGHVRIGTAEAIGLEHTLGFFSLDSRAGARVPLATYTWDCGRWAWLGFAGHGIGRILRSFDRVPTLAIHPRDLHRGFWPGILSLTEELLGAGYEPSTLTQVLEARDAEMDS